MDIFLGKSGLCWFCSRNLGGRLQRNPLKKNCRLSTMPTQWRTICQTAANSKWSSGWNFLLSPIYSELIQLVSDFPAAFLFYANKCTCRYLSIEGYLTSGYYTFTENMTLNLSLRDVAYGVICSWCIMHLQIYRASTEGNDDYKQEPLTERRFWSARLWGNKCSIMLMWSGEGRWIWCLHHPTPEHPTTPCNSR